jgi:hypothetical protein
MCTIPMMFPLDSHGTIYVLQDEKGNTIGTGSRQVCEILLSIITKMPASSTAEIAEMHAFSEAQCVRSYNN